MPPPEHQTHSPHAAWGAFFRGDHLSKRNYALLCCMLAFYGVVITYVLLLLLRPFHQSLAEGPSGDNRLINFLEILYFIANTFVAFVAAGALIFAREQFRQARQQTDQLIRQTQSAESSRLAALYLDISRKWDSEEISRARSAFDTVVEFFERNHQRIQAESGAAHISIDSPTAYVSHILRHDPDGPLYIDSVTLLSFIEDIGLLCRKNYVRLEDINDIIGSGLRYIIGLLLPHIADERGISPPRHQLSRYAHVLWLHRELQTMQPFAVDGYLTSNAQRAEQADAMP